MAADIFSEKEDHLELNRWVGNCFLEVEDGEMWEHSNAEALASNEVTGQVMPHLVEWHLKSGIVHDTFRVNPNTLQDEWVIEKQSFFELHIIVFRSERDKMIYLIQNKRIHN